MEDLELTETFEELGNKGPKKQIKVLKNFKSLGKQSIPEYENFEDLIEAFGSLLLPGGVVNNLRILFDLGGWTSRRSRDT